MPGNSCQDWNVTDPSEGRKFKPGNAPAACRKGMLLEQCDKKSVHKEASKAVELLSSQLPIEVWRDPVGPGSCRFSCGWVMVVW